MNDLERVAELTKALQDGETLEHSDGRKFKMINGVVCNLDGSLNVGIGDVRYLSIQKPKPIFEITENQLAEYECRDGSKAVCWGIPDDRYQNYPYRILYYDGDLDSVTINGRTNTTTEMPTDLIRKIRDL